MELFKKMGPRVILIEYRGRLTGLVTVKDCLKYQFKVEAHDNPQNPGTDHRSEQVWGVMKRGADWVDDKLSLLRRKVGLGGQDIRLPSPRESSDHLHDANRGGVGDIGDRDNASEVELEDRGRREVR